MGEKVIILMQTTRFQYIYSMKKTPVKFQKDRYICIRQVALMRQKWYVLMDG